MSSGLPVELWDVAATVKFRSVVSYLQWYIREMIYIGGRETAVGMDMLW